VHESTEQNQHNAQNQSLDVDIEATKRFVEESRKRREEHEERVRELKKAKDNLPEDKERLDIDSLSHQIYGLDPFVKRARQTEGYEMDYYLDHPEIKTTNQFIKWLIENWEKSL